MSDKKKKLSLKEAMQQEKLKRADDSDSVVEKSDDVVTPFNPDATAKPELVDKKPGVSIQEVMQLRANLKNGTPVDHARALAKFKQNQIKKSGS